MGTMKLYDDKRSEWYSVKTRKKPQGYRNFTDINSKKDLEKSGYKTKIALTPYLTSRYDKPNEKVLYYKKIRKSNPRIARIKSQIKSIPFGHFSEKDITRGVMD